MLLQTIAIEMVEILQSIPSLSIDAYALEIK